MSSPPGIDELIANNRTWAQEKTRADPGFFKRLVAQQRPAYLWVGCSDSRVPANEIVNMDPGELFVHRNIANLTPPQDANFLSVLQFAVQVLKIRHILVVGHYGCGGVLAAMEDPCHGLIDHWIAPIREVYHARRSELDALDPKARHDRLCELNVERQVRNVAANPFVTQAWAEGRDLAIHGWCYSIENGLVNDLRLSIEGPDQAAQRFPGA
jgi:carbonic anhydrase